MQDQYYQKRGFKGLTALSKLIFIAVFLTAAFLVWQMSAKSDIAQAKQAGENVLSDWITATGKMIIAGFICAYAAHFFLPHTILKKQKFYCADCGQFLGYKITRCTNPNCLSNRYTTDPSMAEKAKLKSQNQ
jgi:hypothetical protein